MITNQVIGSNLNYNGKYCELGLTAVYNVFNKPLNPEKTIIFISSWKDFYNVGGDYKFFLEALFLFG